MKLVSMELNMLSLNHEQELQMVLYDHPMRHYKVRKRPAVYYEMKHAP